MTSLSERLNSLGLKKGSEISPPVTKKYPLLSEVINASVMSNSQGKVLVVEKLYPYGFIHGDVLFSDDIKFSEINRMSKLRNSDFNLKNIVFLDTETTGLAGGTGTFAFLIGIAQFTKQGFCLTQFILEDPSDESSLLLALDEYSKNTQAIVSFNGKSFDIPLLRTRYIMNKMSFPFTEKEHIDLLQMSRKIWRQRLASCSLKDLEKDILHLPRTEDEVPGWMIPQIYFDYLRSGDPALIRNVIYHNAMDIMSLAALFIAIGRMFDTLIQNTGMNSLDLFSIGQMYESNGDTSKAIEIYEFCVKNNLLDQEIAINLKKRLGKIYKSQLQWENSIEYWSSNASSGNIDACIELAKYFEHQVKDIKKAIFWTSCAEEYNFLSKKPRHYRNQIMKELLHRRNRLERKEKADV
jgi:uncharacterized protein YprB with RNaseH-like and TPR domain